MAVSIKLDQDEQSRLLALAERRDRSPHYLMRQAIRQFLEREEGRESFLREAVEGWRDYRETGRHLASDDVERWLDSWGTADERAMPDWRG